MTDKRSDVKEIYGITGRDMSCIYTSALMLWAFLLFITVTVFLMYGNIFLVAVPFFLGIAYMTYWEVRYFPNYKEEAVLYILWAFLPLTGLAIIAALSIYYNRPIIFFIFWIVLFGVMLYTNRLTSKECGGLMRMAGWEKPLNITSSTKNKKEEGKACATAVYNTVPLWLAAIFYIIVFTYYASGWYGVTIALIGIYALYKMNIIPVKENSRYYKHMNSAQKRYLFIMILWVFFCYGAPALFAKSSYEYLWISTTLMLVSFGTYYVVVYVRQRRDSHSKNGGA